VGLCFGGFLLGGCTADREGVAIGKASHSGILQALRDRTHITHSLGRQALKPAAPKAAVKVYKYQIDSGNNWLTLIAPNNTLKQAKKRLRFQYGERLKAVVPVE